MVSGVDGGTSKGTVVPASFEYTETGRGSPSRLAQENGKLISIPVEMSESLENSTMKVHNAEIGGSSASEEGLAYQPIVEQMEPILMDIPSHHPPELLTSLDSGTAPTSSSVTELISHLSKAKENVQIESIKEHSALLLSVSEALNCDDPMGATERIENKQMIIPTQSVSLEIGRRSSHEKDGSGKRILVDIRKVKKGRIGKAKS
ncbi:hypothetical protein J5N97_025778 [Dioscorea zingiberensis]|uniref:Uncharacterized protein n=1 Tax=Dioscorea zingiberensis TaxID=325984 RepID=A0A9D5C176_9LILI|nr:hypothetical protein J5N97_025778 [Dioscorea zingiberensis]